MPRLRRASAVSSPVGISRRGADCCVVSLARARCTPVGRAGRGRSSSSSRSTSTGSRAAASRNSARASSGRSAGWSSRCSPRSSCWALEGSQDAVEYTTVYLIERSLSLDNLFVFLLLFAYFGDPDGVPRAAAVLGHHRGAGAAARRDRRRHRAAQPVPLRHLLPGGGAARPRGPDLARRGESVDPDKNLMVRLVRKVFPVSSDMHYHYFVHRGRRAQGHAAAALPRRRRVRRHRLRDRLDPGRVRDHPRPVHHLDGQRLRAARPARAVRARRGPGAPLPLPRPDDRDRARRRGGQARDRGPGARSARSPRWRSSPCSSRRHRRCR